MIFQTKPQIALGQIDRALANGIRVMAWSADEFYGRDGAFLDGLDERRQAFVVEVPSDARFWLEKPEVLRKPLPNRPGRPYSYPRLRRPSDPPREARNLARHSPCFHEQRWQRYRIKDTQRGSQVWEVRWHAAWRKTHTAGLVSRQGTLIVARNVLTGEVKYFYSNRVPGRDGWTVRRLLQVAFGRWPVEDCFRESKEELGLDHYECRGWRCIHRHLAVVILSQLFCARVRLKLSPSEEVTSGERVTDEQVRRATNVFLAAHNLPRRARRKFYAAEIARQQYYARRNASAARSHRKTRRARLLALGIDPGRIKSVPPKGLPP